MQLYTSLVTALFSECPHFMHPINSIENGWIHIKNPSYSVTYDEMRQQTTSNGCTNFHCGEKAKAMRLTLFTNISH